MGLLYISYLIYQILLKQDERYRKQGNISITPFNILFLSHYTDFSHKSQLTQLITSCPELCQNQVKNVVNKIGTIWLPLYHYHKTTVGKAFPLQAWSGPEGPRKLRFPDFMTTAQDVGKVVSLTHRPPLPPGNAPGTHFC